MDYEKEILEIERERLKREIIRDRHASYRFIVGTVLLAFATSGVSWYITVKQGKVAIENSRELQRINHANSEKLSILPHLVTIPSEEYAEKIEVIDRLLKMPLSMSMKTFLLEEKEKVSLEKKEYEKAVKAKELALQEKENAEQKAEEAKRAADAEEARRASEEADSAKKRAEQAEAKAKKILNKSEIRLPSYEDVNGFYTPGTRIWNQPK